MSNEVRKYSVDCAGARHTLEGTGFHIDEGHLYVEYGSENCAAFRTGDWLSIRDISPVTKEITITFADGMTIDDAMKSMERLNERRNHTLGGLL